MSAVVLLGIHELKAIIMKGGCINLVDLDFEYKIWKLRLDLFRKEISIIKDRNEEVKSEENIEELTSEELERIEKEFKELTFLYNRIKVQEQELRFYNKDFPITTEHQFHKEHEGIRDRVEDVSKKHIEYIAYLMDVLSL